MSALPVAAYYRDLQNCPSGSISWSHSARFKTALRLTGRGVRRLLDYGCGDGTFLEMAAGRYVHGVGADVADDLIRDCRERLDRFNNLQFHNVAELTSPEHDRAYDLVTCMETLEHCVPAVAERVLGDLQRLVAPEGRVIISVPIETGPIFPIKFVLRKIAGWQGIGHYRHYENYKIGDALKMLFAGEHTEVERPAYGEPGHEFYTHYGFNWRAFRLRVMEKFTIVETRFSPISLLGGWFNSQAWFVCRPRTT